MNRRALLPIATAAAALSAAAMIAPAALAAESCPAGKVCLYDNADYTNLLLATSERMTPWIGKKFNDKVTSVINNTNTDLHLFKHINYVGVNGTIAKGKKYAFEGAFDNQVSSFNLY